MLLKIEQVSHHFLQGSKKYNERCCFENININIHSGEFHCIIGASGSGKSTLLNIASGMLTPSAGNIYWDDVNVYKKLKEKARTNFRNGKIGYMMQGVTLLYSLTVYENIICPIGLAGQKADQQAIEELLKRLHIWDVRKSYPSELSGGECRRASLARTLAANPQIIIADEPTSNLDTKSAEFVRGVLAEYCKGGKSVVVATHDMEFIRSECIVYTINKDNKIINV